MNRTLNIKTDEKVLTAKEKKELAEKFHPDFSLSDYGEIAFGVNKGIKVPKNLANLLSGKSLTYENKLYELSPDYVVDTLIIGGGGAGCAAALEAVKCGSVILATKFRLGDGNTLMAEGGIQAADKEGDSEKKHFTDTFKGGSAKGDSTLINQLVSHGADTIAFLENLGVGFDKDENGEMIERYGGGTSFPRMHCAKDCTGLEMMRVLKKEVFSSDVKILEYLSAVEILTDDNNRAVGAVFVNTENYKKTTVIYAKSVIVATGGAGRLYYGDFPTSNSYGSTGDGVVLCYRAGAELVDIDSLQYHPTGALYPQFLRGALITEKVRSLGAKLVNNQGKSFIDPMETRDVVCASIIGECREGRGVNSGKDVGVFLDTPMIDLLHGKGTTETELPNLYKTYLKAGIDITKEPILVYPTLHYQNGGVKIDEFGRTAVKNLYAVGEVAGGVHGRNRLMGNSLLEVIVFGRIAGETAGKDSANISVGVPSAANLKKYYGDCKGIKDEYSPQIMPKIN